MFHMNFAFLQNKSCKAKKTGYNRKQPTERGTTMSEEKYIIDKYMPSLCADAAERYAIPAKIFTSAVHRGLRNEDGTGVLVGATRIGSVRGYYMEDGERVPMNGQLLYRGIKVSEIADNHWQNGTFGYEEVAYLLLLGKLLHETGIFSFETVRKALEKNTPAKRAHTIDNNMRALQLGADYQG